MLRHFGARTPVSLQCGKTSADTTRSTSLPARCCATNVPRNGGMVLLTSRVSVEMVQKTAAIGAPLIVAVSAPTALAVRTAEAAGITLVAVARDDGFEVFTHPQRIKETTSKQSVTHVDPDKLIYMANQIAKFFESQGPDKAVAGTADHIRKFWDPRMRAADCRASESGRRGLDPVARAAIENCRK